MLKPGTTLSHYRLEEKIGQGGMGEVWRARDGRLDREVALKILPDAVASDHSRLDRFTREAKLLASLNHPSIATIHDVDVHEGVRFIVMELVPGLDLGQLLERGALSVDEALKVGVQVARALEVAHGQGVVHRDLKPANVKRTPDDKIKVLDFGLAKAMDPESTSGDPNATSSPTVTSAGTIAGVILGTAAYMSPEQARGKPIDKRTDVWSFGVLLYELLTGDNPFRGGTVADSVGAIMHRDPDLEILPPQTPTAVKRLLRRCLVRERADRLHDIADARIELEEAIANPVVEADLTPAAGTQSSKLPWLALALLLPLAIAITAWLSSSGEAPSDAGVRKFVLAPDAEVDEAKISPDGKMIAYVTNAGVHLRALESLESRLIYATDGGQVTEIFWSPDSQKIGACNIDGEIRSIPISGAAPTLLADARAFTESGVWAEDGYIYIIMFQSGLSRIPESGGAPEVIDAGIENFVDFHGMTALPDGRGLLVIPHQTTGPATAIHLFRDGEPLRKIFETDASIGRPSYSTSGHLLYHRTESPRGIWAVPFSLDAMETTGAPFLVESQLRNISVSNRGDLVFARSELDTDGEESELVWLSESGEVTRRYEEPVFSASGTPTLSPDGNRVALLADRIGSARSDNKALWVIDIERQSSMMLTEFDIYSGDPIWSEDGTRIAILADAEDGKKSIVGVAADGSGDVETLIEVKMNFFFDLTRDWSRAVVCSGEMGTGNNFGLFDMAVGTKDDPTVLVDGPRLEAAPAIHPDSNWLLYSEGDIPNLQLFVTRYPDGSGRQKISRDAVFALGSWSEDGKTIYFEARVPGSDESNVYLVSFDGSQEKPILGQPELLFTVSTSTPVSPLADGTFLTAIPVPREDDDTFDPNGIVVIQNWPARFNSAP